MKIAVPYQDGMIFQHFGHSERFKIYKTVDGQVTEAKILDVCGAGHCALAGLLINNGVDVLICGGIGAGAQNALAAAGNKHFGGVQGDADAAVAAYLAGKLNYDPHAKCDHHEHHGADHQCGEHGCGGHCHH